MTEREQGPNVGGVAAGVRHPRRLHPRARRVLQQLRDRAHGYRDGWVKTRELRGSDRQALWHTLRRLEATQRVERQPDAERAGHYVYRITASGAAVLAHTEAHSRELAASSAGPNGPL